MSERICAVEDCDQRPVARGWCGKHYQRWKKHGDPLHECTSYKSVCSVDGCTEIGVTRGWCGKHYVRVLKHGDPLVLQRASTHKGATCAVDTCQRQRRKLEWCDAHYQRWKKHGHPFVGCAIQGKGQPRTGTCCVDGCSREQASCGRCLMHYKRWHKHGTDTVPTIADRLWNRVAQSSGCWEWTGNRSEFGYGRISVDGRSTSTHRLSWHLTYGPIPDGLDVLHHCDNPPCVRPDHLFLGTDFDNAADKMAKGRGNNTYSGRGRKLTWSLVEAMRVATDGGASLSPVAKEYGVSVSMVSLIARRIAWDPKKRLPTVP